MVEIALLPDDKIPFFDPLGWPTYTLTQENIEAFFKLLDRGIMAAEFERQKQAGITFIQHCEIR